jgi:two-component sensor histidine kinase
MKRLFSAFLNPFLLSLWGTLILLLIFPIRIEKYKVTITEQGEYLNDQIVRFDDLDNDGNSEKISVFHNSLGSAGLTVSNLNGVLDQWTFQGRYAFTQHPGNVITGDRDGDGLKEIYIFTLSGDSILLHCISDYKELKVPIRNKFVAKVGNRGNKYDPFMISAQMDDLTSDGSKELIFGIGTGYSLYPRHIYAYDILLDTFRISPPSGYFIQGIIQEDINNDAKRELIIKGYAASNIHDSSVPYPDWNCWLMALNQNLRFEFEPVPFPEQFSNLYPFIFEDDSARKVLAALYCPPTSQGDSCKIITCGCDGRIRKQKLVDAGARGVMIIQDKKDRSQIMINKSMSGIDIYDNSFRLKKSIAIASDFFFMPMDVDLDGSVEVVLTDANQRKIFIYRNEMNQPVIVDFKGNGEKGVLFSMKQKSDNKPELYVQLGSSYNLFQYGKNDLYRFRFLLYAAVYLSILLFTLLVRKVQREQIRKKLQTERKITDLQLQIIRNQLDPHFIMNAINSIIASISDKEKEDAKKQLQHFSRLHRSLLLSSDQIQRSLQEEIEFTENYLALEKFRFRDKFDYRLSIEPVVNRNMLVPKMILQIHVENALKHGILPMDKQGLLTIGVFEQEDKLILEITDNGVGRYSSKEHETGSTGRGLAVMEQYSELFNRVHSGKITTTIEDLVGVSGRPEGTRVSITLSGFYEKQQE